MKNSKKLIAELHHLKEEISDLRMINLAILNKLATLKTSVPPIFDEDALNKAAAEAVARVPQIRRDLAKA